MTKEIEMLIQISTLRDVEIEIVQSKINGQIIPEIVIEILRKLETDYRNKNE